MITFYVILCVQTCYLPLCVKLASRLCYLTSEATDLLQTEVICLFFDRRGDPP